MKIAEGCRNCYAETWSKRNPGTLGIWGSESSGATRVVAAESYWRDPTKWDTFAGMSPELGRPRVFCASLADVFENWQGPMVNAKGERLYRNSPDASPPWDPIKEEYAKACSYLPISMQVVRDRVFRLIDATPHLDWLLLTKRPENVLSMLPAVEIGSQIQADDRNERGELFRRNVWLGVSCATQADCDRLIPELLNCRDLAAKVFVSLEPLVESVDLWPWLCSSCPSCSEGPHDPETGVVECRRCDSTGVGEDPSFEIDWVIVGGESGPNARPCNVEWIRDVVQQCKAAGVPCFVKQLGANVGFGLTDPKGGDPSEWPEDLRVREVPE